MPDKPAAEVSITAELVRTLVAAQALDRIPDAAALPLEKVAEGWDNEMWRLGRFAVRLPRRAASASLVLHERMALPQIAERLEPLGVGVPAPLVDGFPSEQFPWHWSIVPWLDGRKALAIDRAERTAWAERLAEALIALHVPSSGDHPVNPVRGVPLADRAAAVTERFGMLRAGGLPAALVARADVAWRAGLAAAPWTGPPLWIHGDLHPGNLVIREDELVAIIDFGDVTAGDPAYDLAVAWLAFDASGRARFRAATGDRYDDAAWVRARAWAAAIAVLVLAYSDDEPDFARLGLETLEELGREQGKARARGASTIA